MTEQIFSDGLGNISIEFDDALAALARNPETTVSIVGAQLNLFSNASDTMVRVTDGITAIVCTAKKARSFGLFPVKPCRKRS